MADGFVDAVAEARRDIASIAPKDCHGEGVGVIQNGFRSVELFEDDEPDVEQ